MNILITGSNGFLGNIICDFLKDHHCIFGLNRSNSNYNLDLSNSSPLFFNDFDLVIHCAGKAHSVSNAENDLSSFENINVNGTVNLLNGLKHIGSPRYFLFISSVSVYGLSHGSLVNETSPLNAVDPYGLSKIKSEILVQEWCNLNNVVCTIFRLPLVVGANPPGNLKAMINGIRYGYYFNINGGKTKKSMVLASDVAKFVEKASIRGGIFNLTDRYHPTFSELSCIIAKRLEKSYVFNMPLWVAFLMAKFGDLFGFSFFNTPKLNKINSTLTFSDKLAVCSFGWNPMPVLNNFKL
jgi:nucleoside-diphosphate-sugar epimerase